MYQRGMPPDVRSTRVSPGFTTVAAVASHPADGRAATATAAVSAEVLPVVDGMPAACPEPLLEHALRRSARVPAATASCRLRLHLMG